MLFCISELANLPRMSLKKLTIRNPYFGETVIDFDYRTEQQIEANTVEVKRCIKKAPEIDPKLLDEKHFDAEFAKDPNYAYKVLAELHQLRIDYETYKATLYRRAINIQPMLDESSMKIINITDMIFYINCALHPPAPIFPEDYLDENLSNDPIYFLRIKLNTLDQAYHKYHAHIQSLVRDMTDDDSDVSAAYQRQEKINERAHFIHGILAEKITQLFNRYLEEKQFDLAAIETSECIPQLSSCMHISEEDAARYLEQFSTCIKDGQSTKKVIEEVMLQIRSLKN